MAKRDRTELVLRNLCAALGLDADELLSSPVPKIKARARALLTARKAEPDEMDVATQRFTVTLGGKKRTFRKLPIGQDREWRRRLTDVIMPVLPKVQEVLSSGGPEKALVAFFPSFFTTGVEELVDMFFLYTGLDRKQIEEECAPEDILDAAMGAFVACAVPLLQRPFMQMAKAAKGFGLMK